MNLYKINNKWNNILYGCYNFAARLLFLGRYKKIHTIVKRNKKFKNLHSGKRCFVVLNGPSLNDNNLSLIKDEIVFCSNYFYKADAIDIVKPNYYCWLDSGIFKNQQLGRETIKELQTKCPNVDLFLNFKAYTVVARNKHTYFTYNKHLPSTDGVSTKIDGLSSGYTNVLGYIIGIAIFMGFKEIDILGLDFEPGGFKHFQNEVDGTKKQDSRNEDTLTEYGSILKAHSEFIGLEAYSRKHGIIIKNLNPNSYVRAFEFSTLEDVLGKGKNK